MPSAPNPFPEGSPAYNIRSFLNIRAGHTPQNTQAEVVRIPRFPGRNPVPETVLYESDLEALLHTYALTRELLYRVTSPHPYPDPEETPDA